MGNKDFGNLRKNEVNSKRVIEEYDERQKNIRNIWALRAFTVGALLCVINTFIMEEVYQWSSFSAATLIFAAVGVAVFVVGTVLSDSYNALNDNGRQGIVLGFLVVLEAFVLIMSAVDDGFQFIEDGMFTNKAMLAINSGLILLMGIFYFTVRHIKKKKERDE